MIDQRKPYERPRLVSRYPPKLAPEDAITARPVGAAFMARIQINSLRVYVPSRNDECRVTLGYRLGHHSPGHS